MGAKRSYMHYGDHSVTGFYEFLRFLCYEVLHPVIIIIFFCFYRRESLIYFFITTYIIDIVALFILTYFWYFCKRRLFLHFPHYRICFKIHGLFCQGSWSISNSRQMGYFSTKGGLNSNAVDLVWKGIAKQKI